MGRHESGWKERQQIEHRNLVDLPQRRHSTYCLIITELSRLPSLPFTVGLDNLLFSRCSIRPDGSYSVVLVKVTHRSSRAGPHFSKFHGLQLLELSQAWGTSLNVGSFEFDITSGAINWNMKEGPMSAVAAWSKALDPKRGK